MLIELVLGIICVCLCVVIARRHLVKKSLTALPASLPTAATPLSPYHDLLTGLPNRELLFDRIHHALAKVERSGDILAVLCIDIDRFSLVNDTLGYLGGDKVIKLISDRLRKAIRECDTVARLAGDEFCVLLELINNVNEAAAVAKRIERSLNSTFEVEGQELALSASIGISIYPTDTRNINDMLSFADMAMQQVKERGGAGYRFYTGDMNISSTKRLVEEHKLRMAIERNEYRVFYQPKVDFQRCKLLGMEALLRWERDDKTIVAPGKFISLLEESGLILPVGEWIMREACNAAQRWNAQGFGPLTVSVNVSARQFRQLDFVDIVANILKDTTLDPACLEIEVTEGVLMEDTQASVTTLEALKALGVRIAIDDFGTGYSSLAYLQRYAVDILKIDRSFVGNIGQKAEGSAIATTIVALAHNLRLDLIAEGVETMAQLNFLTALGCEQVQGFLFSPPVSIEEFDRFVRNPGLLFANLVSAKKNISSC